MAEVKILIKGYTTADLKENQDEKTCPTITLVKDNNINIICDPGVVENQSVITNVLKKEGLTINDIDIVFLTHSHLDHYRNTGMFPRAKVLEFFGIWDGNKCADWQEKFSKDIQIIKTPGHNSNSITMLVKTNRGQVAICGDVFWKENYPKKDPYASNLKKLAESRGKVIKLADYIIPGHGDIFKVIKK